MKRRPMLIASLVGCLAGAAGLPGCSGCGTRLTGDGALDVEVAEPRTDEPSVEDEGLAEAGDPETMEEIPVEATDGDGGGDGDGDPGADVEPDDEVPLTETWLLTFGDGNRDGGAAVIATASGGIVVVGEAYVHLAGPSLWAANLAGDGTVLWQRALGGDGYAYYEPFAVVESSGGDFIAAGEVNIFDENLFDMWIVRLDREGHVLWQKSIGGTGQDVALSVIEGGDGSIFVGGRTASYSLGYDDVWLIKLDPDGAVVWQKAIGGAGYDVLHGMTQVAGGDIIVSAETGSFGSTHPDLWLLAFDESGALLRQKAIGGDGYDYGHAILQARDGSLYIAGSTLSFGEGFYDLWLLKTGVSGDVLWQKTLGGGDMDGAMALFESADGSILVAGRTQSYGNGSEDAWVVKFDGSGGVLWQTALGSSGSESAAAITERLEGGIALAGQSNGLGEGAMDILAAKLTAGGGIPSCPLVTDSAAVPHNSNAVSHDTEAVTRDTDAAARDTSASELDPGYSPMLHCP